MPAQALTSQLLFLISFLMILFWMKTCLMVGCDFDAISPTTFEFVGTSLHPNKSSPCLLISFSKLFIHWLAWLVFWGRKTIPTEYWPGWGKSNGHSFTKKSCGISIKIPAPSPVLPSALTAPLCSRHVKILRALWIILLVFFPVRLQINPQTKVSLSIIAQYNPCI